MSRLFIIDLSSVGIAMILARGKYDMTISYVLPSRKYDMSHINLNSPRKQSLSVDIRTYVRMCRSWRAGRATARKDEGGWVGGVWRRRP